jgi:hypothetical protein
MEQTIAAPEQHPEKKGKFKKFLLVTMFIILAGLVIFYFVAGMSYSEGTRSGILTKVSKKGYVFKTYEGEMLIGGMSEGEGTMLPATVFYFSITDREIYDKLEGLQGQKVIVRYKQVLKPFFWQGDTDYFITEAKAVQEG